MDDADPRDLFPTECHFKVITIDLVGVHAALNQALAELEIDAAFQPSQRSAQGKYLSYDLSLMVETYEHMKRIDDAIRKVEGVKLIL